MKKIKDIRRTSLAVTLFFLISSLLFCYGCAKDPLTPEERNWLKSHDGKIKYGSETHYPPFSFINSNGNMSGIEVEYISLIEKKLGFNFKKVYFKTWYELVENAKKGKIDALGTISPTPERKKHLLFTDHYAEYPTVIIVNENTKGDISLDKMGGFKIAVSKGYGVSEYLNDNFPDLDIVFVDNDFTGMKMTASKRVDAVITDLPVSTHFIKHEHIKNLRVAGLTGHTYQLSIASGKERKAITRKWLNLTPDKKIRINSITASVLLLLISVLLYLICLKRYIYSKKNGQKLSEALKKQARKPAFLFFSVLVLIACLVPVISRIPVAKLSSSANSLSPEEKAWLKNNDGSIRLAPDPNWPPIEFFDNHGVYSGIAADYIKRIEARFGFSFQRVRLSSWDEILTETEQGNVDMLGGIIKTPERSDLLLFTQPYITVPNVILTRKEYEGNLSLDTMNGMVVAIIRGHAIVDYVEKNFSVLNLQFVSDNSEGLKKLSFGEVDAMITSLPSASWFIEKNKITNLRIAGDTGFSYSLSFASRKEMPLLHKILEKGLAGITDNEKKQIHNRWFGIARERYFDIGNYWFHATVVIVILTVPLILTVLWNRTLKKTVKIQTEELEKELKNKILSENRLRKSEEQYKSIFNHAPLGIFHFDKNGKITDCNNIFADMLGVKREQIISFNMLTSLKDEKMLRALKKTTEGGMGYFEGPYETVHTGKVVYVKVTTRPIFSKDNEFIGAVGIVEETSERIRTEKELERTRNYLDNVVNSMPSVLIGLDPDGKISDMNIEAEKLSVLTSQEASGRPLESAFPDLCEHMEGIEGLVRDKRKYEKTNILYFKNDIPRYINIILYPLMGKNTEGAVLRIDDVTEKVRLEEIMVQTEKMMSVGGLAAGMAHEINNPLGIILQSIQNTKRRLSPGMEGNIAAAFETGTDIAKVISYLEKRGILKYIDAIQDAGKRAAEIVKNMLEFSRESKSGIIPTDIHTLLDNTLKLAESDYDLKKKYDFKHIKIDRFYCSDMPPVPCSPSKIEQVLLNIIKNAAQALYESGKDPESFKIILKTAIEPAFARIEIEDNGPGMDEKTRKRIFEPFFTTKSVDTGTGLGLSVSYFIITSNHSGTIHAESKQGKGTKFIIRLPLLQ